MPYSMMHRNYTTFSISCDRENFLSQVSTYDPEGNSVREGANDD